MSELRTLSFPQIGMLIFEDDETLGKSAMPIQESADTERVLSYPTAKPYIGPSYQFNFGGQRNEDFLLEGPEILPAFEKSQAWLKAQLQDWIDIWSGQPGIIENATKSELNGTAMLYFLILFHLPRSDHPVHGCSADQRDHNKQIHETPAAERVMRESFVIRRPTSTTRISFATSMAT